MDSGNESEPSSLKLREYAKRASIGTIKQLDGTIDYVPSWDDEPDLVNQVAGEINKIEKRLGERTPFLRWVYSLFLFSRSRRAFLKTLFRGAFANLNCSEITMPAGLSQIAIM